MAMEPAPHRVLFKTSPAWYGGKRIGCRRHTSQPTTYTPPADVTSRVMSRTRTGEALLPCVRGLFGIFGKAGRADPFSGGARPDAAHIRRKRFL